MEISDARDRGYRALFKAIFGSEPVPGRGKELMLAMDNAIEKLPEVQFNVKLPLDKGAQVLKLRFGLGDGKPRTLRDVSNMFDVTPERIRQVEGKTLRQLRHPYRSTDLKQFLP